METSLPEEELVKLQAERHVSACGSRGISVLPFDSLEAGRGPNVFRWNGRVLWLCLTCIFSPLASLKVALETKSRVPPALEISIYFVSFVQVHAC